MILISLRHLTVPSRAGRDRNGRLCVVIQRSSVDTTFLEAEERERKARKGDSRDYIEEAIHKLLRL